ncbi:hypothetical protein E0F66_12495, partial [Streptococcus pyogenes]
MTEQSEPGVYGMNCFNCDAQVESNSEADLEREAIKASWSIGLLADAQAYYSCPGCAGLLFKANKLVPVLSAED